MNFSDDHRSGDTTPSTPTTFYSSVFIDGTSHNSNGQETKSDCVGSDSQSKISQCALLYDDGRSSSTDDKEISEYAFARSRIAIEAAKEARRRQAMKYLYKTHLEQEPYVVTSIGRGSSAADAIHQRDGRPIWKQGYDDGNSSDVERCKIKENFDLVTPMESIAEQAAAVGRSKLQKLLLDPRQDTSMDRNEQLDLTSKPQTATAHNANEVEQNEERKSCGIVVCEDGKTNQVVSQSNKDQTSVNDL